MHRSITIHACSVVSLILAATLAICEPGCTARPGGVADTAAPSTNRACALACADPDAGDNAIICYSCRCKEALGALPTPEEMKCSDGEEIVVFRDGEKVTTEVPDCENPALLYTVPSGSACLPGSRMKQFTKGDATFKLICRRKEWHPNWARPTEDSIYEDVGLIGYNPKTGATCFWDDALDQAHDGDALTNIDLTTDSHARAREFAGAWLPIGDGATCLQCHDSDPFIRTSYLRSLTSFPNPGRSPDSPYALVSPTGPVALVDTGLSHLTSDSASACTGCHRIGLGETCTNFAPDAMGFKATIPPHVRPYQEHATDNAGTNTAGYGVAYWMPLDLPPDHAAWQEELLATKNHLMRCCGPAEHDAGAHDDECTLSPMPGPRGQAGAAATGAP
ncbi:MAG: hypothetical protein KF795_17400 [Labilithrix sp.]|nr:hypothetical protein [Labilithrix sp.]